jgi:hypothetical protein
MVGSRAGAMPGRHQTDKNKELDGICQQEQS